MRKLVILTSVLLTMTAIVFISMKSAPAWDMTDELREEIEAKQKALEENPDDPHAHFDLAITYSYSNKVQEGWDELKKVNEIDEEFAPLALEMYSKEVEANPDDWKKRFRLAFALYFNDMKREAIEEMNYIAEMEPKDDTNKRLWAYGYMGLIYGEEDEDDLAVEYVKKAIEIDTDVAALHMLLAAGYQKQGKGWEAFWEGLEALRLKALGY